MTTASTSTLGFTHRFVRGTAGTAGTTLLLLHGTGGDENDLLPLGEALLSGASMLSPRGKVLEHGMPRFFRRLAEGVFDVEDLKARTRELATFVRDATVAYSLDPARTIAVGFSNGANIAASLHLLEPDVLAGSILIRAMVPLEPDVPPRLAGVPILLSSGTADPMVPRANSERLARLLERFGAAVTTHWEPGGHALGEGDVRAAREWLEERGLGPGAKGLGE